MILTANLQVYESCFGPEVVKEVRKEMKLATAKCTGLSTAPLKIQHFDPPQHQAMTGVSLGKPQVAASSQVHTIQMHSKPAASTETPAQSFDLNKLQQVIMSGYNKHVQVKTTL